MVHYLVPIISLLLYLGNYVQSKHRTSFYVYSENHNKTLVVPWIAPETIFSPDTHAYIMLLHGEVDDSSEEIYEKIIAEYKKYKKNYVYILIDWSDRPVEVTCNDNYETMRVVSDEILAFITNYNVAVERIHMVGYSRGAHLAGAIGKLSSQWLFKKIYRITALDPCNECFEQLSKANSDVRLSRDDANVVNLLHTNAGGYGIVEDLGVINFYANKGTVQPSCGFFESACSHSRSLEIYLKSINPSVKLVGIRCNDYPDDCDFDDRMAFSPATKPVATHPVKYYFSTKGLH